MLNIHNNCAGLFVPRAAMRSNFGVPDAARSSCHIKLERAQADSCLSPFQDAGGRFHSSFRRRQETQSKIKITVRVGTICSDRASLSMMDSRKPIKIHNRHASVEGAILLLFVLALMFLAVGYY